MTIVYSPDALVYNAGTNSWSLKPGYDITQDRVDVQFNDDDGYLDGDYITGEIGDDANQTATINDMQGNEIVSGLIYAEEYYKLELPGGGFAYVDVLEIGGVVVGYTTTVPLEEGVDYTQIFTGNVGAVDDNGQDSRLDYSSLSDVPCFGPGTHLMTSEGEIPVEWLATGDRLLTRDHGAQKVLWIGRYKASVADMVGNSGLVPCAIAAGAFGPDCPTHDTLLSGQHRVLLSGHQIELHTGTHEAFAAAKHLVDGATIIPANVATEITYTHVLLAQHEVILANGLWVESLFLGSQFDASTDVKIPRHLMRDPVIRAGHARTARLCLKKWEISALMGKRRRESLPAMIQRVA